MAIFSAQSTLTPGNGEIEYYRGALYGALWVPCIRGKRLAFSCLQQAGNTIFHPRIHGTRSAPQSAALYFATLKGATHK